MDNRNLQKALGVTADGILGIGTFTALFRKLGASPARAADLAVAANRFFPEYGVLDSGLRLAHFLAQLGHESGSFKYMEEIASGEKYEGRKDLGNTQAGDGKRYKGRGPIQLTGRANYRTYGRAIGIDLESNPEIAAVPSIGLHTALEYWKSRKINALADRDDLTAVTRAVNGGTNGFEDRKRRLSELKGWIL